MKPVVKESEKRLKILESEIWQGIANGIDACKNEATIPEINKVLLKYVFNYNERNLDAHRKTRAKKG